MLNLNDVGGGLTAPFIEWRGQIGVRTMIPVVFLLYSRSLQYLLSAGSRPGTVLGAVGTAVCCYDGLN